MDDNISRQAEASLGPRSTSGQTTPRPAFSQLPIIRPPEGYGSCEATDYQYQPLPNKSSIRLLRLFAPDRHLEDPINAFIRPPIRCSMATVDLDGSPVYDALSYTWGDPCSAYDNPHAVSPPAAWASRSFDILVDGNPVSVGTNLYTALVALRAGMTLQEGADAKHRMEVPYSGYIWIDALCINQGDLDERSSQVMIMRRIYKQAQVVFAWLGGGEPHADQAIADMKGITRVLNPSVSDTDTMRPLNITDRHTYEKLGIPSMDANSWIGMYLFLHRSWFKRAWIVQELAFARCPVFLCGLEVLQLELLLHATSVLIDSGWLLQMERLAGPLLEDTEIGNTEAWYRTLVRQGKNRRIYLDRSAGPIHGGFAFETMELRLSVGSPVHSIPGVQILDLHPPRKTLLSLLQSMRGKQVSDPRDKVYAFLGMSREEEEHTADRSPSALVDYSRSVEDVYMNTAKYIMAVTNNLNILSFKTARTNISLPSWVPDLSAHQLSPSLQEYGVFCASFNLDGSQFSPLEDNRLRVLGIKIGVIQSIADANPVVEPDTAAFLQQLPSFSEIRKIDNIRGTLPRQDLVNIYQRCNGDSIIERQSRFEVYWRTLICDRFGRIHPALKETGDAALSQAHRALNSMQIFASFPLFPTDLAAALREGFKSRAYTSKRDQPFDLEGARDRLSNFHLALQSLLGPTMLEGSGDNMFPAEYAAFERSWAAEPDVEKKHEMAAAFVLKMSQREYSKDVHEYFTHVETNSFQRKLFILDAGYLGLGLETMQVGDEVYVLAGADVPFIIRRDGPDRYRLIGEAYVHGMMHGEAIAEQSRQSLRTIVLV
ncbi:heterokaryon incompatibility protein-domain-containing protein [Xylariales sp. PMI_506]|nr:heterokaryon incompatibility protein-domain-containing protein [Xylariales sp. PMI_506]